MAHDCRIGDIQVHDDACGILYVTFYKFLRTLECRVDFCPVCGHPSSVKLGDSLAVFSRNDVRNDRKDNHDKPRVPPIPSSSDCYRPLGESCGPPIDPIGHFFSQWTDRIEELNKNIDAIKAFMISQNCQNECFMDQQMEIKKRLTALEKSWTTSET